VKCQYNYLLKSTPTLLKRRQLNFPPLGGVRGDLKRALKIFFKSILKSLPTSLKREE